MSGKRACLILLVFHSTLLSEREKFEDVTAASGIDFVHYNAATEEKFMVETMGSGGGFLDYDGDSDLDVYLLNGAPLPGAAPSPIVPRNRLYRNDGGGRFQDVTELAGVGDEGYGMGMTAGDVDNDGDLDLYVTNFGDDVFYRNNGDGTFTEATEKAGLGAGGWSTSAAFGDFDNDGVLDLYVGRYVNFTLENHKFCGNLAKNIRAYCHPDVYDPTPGILFRGRGDGSFEEVTREAGVLLTGDGKSLGVVWGDVDNDSDLDLYVANDSMRNFLFENEGNGRFRDVTLLAGVGYSENGQTQAGMGTDMADFDGDGFMDLTVTNLDFEYNALYRGTEKGIFEDVSYSTGLAEASFNYVGFGTFFFDFDNDGDEDLFVANGHIIDNIEQFNGISTYRERNFVFENDGRGSFEEIASRMGAGLLEENVARGAAPGDIDGDGDEDVLVTRCGGATQILRNDASGENRSLSFRLVGRRVNRDGVGARVVVELSGRRVMKELKTGRSYLSQGELRIHFGLGTQEAAEAVEIRWPGGRIERLGSVPSGQWTLLEGIGAVAGGDVSAVLTFR